MWLHQPLTWTLLGSLLLSMAYTSSSNDNDQEGRTANYSQNRKPQVNKMSPKEASRPRCMGPQDYGIISELSSSTTEEAKITIPEIIEEAPQSQIFKSNNNATQSDSIEDQENFTIFDEMAESLEDKVFDIVKSEKDDRTGKVPETENIDEKVPEVESVDEMALKDKRPGDETPESGDFGEAPRVEDFHGKVSEVEDTKEKLPEVEDTKEKLPEVEDSEETVSEIVDPGKEKIKSDKDEEIYRIIFLGPPLSGKRTQAQNVKEKYNVCVISLGEWVQEERIASDDELLEHVGKELSREECLKGFLLAGFPKTLAQAKKLDNFLENHGLMLSHVIHFQMPDDTEIFERSSKLLLHPSSGRVYNDSDRKPKLPYQDDLTHDPLERHPLQTDVQLMRKLLRNYKNEATNLQRLYQDADIYYPLDAGRSRSKVWDDIQRILEGLPRQTTVGDYSANYSSEFEDPSFRSDRNWEFTFNHDESDSAMEFTFDHGSISSRRYREATSGLYHPADDVKGEEVIHRDTPIIRSGSPFSILSSEDSKDKNLDEEAPSRDQLARPFTPEFGDIQVLPDDDEHGDQLLNPLQDENINEIFNDIMEQFDNVELRSGEEDLWGSNDNTPKSDSLGGFDDGASKDEDNDDHTDEQPKAPQEQPLPFDNNPVELVEHTETRIQFLEENDAQNEAWVPVLDQPENQQDNGLNPPNLMLNDNNVESDERDSIFDNQPDNGIYESNNNDEDIVEFPEQRTSSDNRPQDELLFNNEEANEGVDQPTNNTVKPSKQPTPRDDDTIDMSEHLSPRSREVSLFGDETDPAPQQQVASMIRFDNAREQDGKARDIIFNYQHLYPMYISMGPVPKDRQPENNEESYMELFAERVVLKGVNLKVPKKLLREASDEPLYVTSAETFRFEVEVDKDNNVKFSKSDN